MKIRLRFMTAVRLIRVRNLVRHTQRGFTLLELMIVLALIGLIAGAVGVAVHRRWVDGQIKTAQIQVHEIGGHVAQYLIMRNTCPTVEDLVREHYLPREPKDPWGTPLLIHCPGQHEQDAADVTSYGKDKTPDTADDIKSWEL